jgi:peroxiredoxin
MAVQPEIPELGIAAPKFALPSTTGAVYSLADIAGPKGTVVVFICNHCPYVKSATGRLVEATRALSADGIGFAAICSNDAETYPEDSFENMKAFARENGFPFPYLHDESQETAKAWKAVCTPDFFGLDADGIIRYRGRLDEGRTTPPPRGAKAELVDAMREIAATGQGPAVQIPSIGCGIKWKA